MTTSAELSARVRAADQRRWRQPPIASPRPRQEGPHRGWLKPLLPSGDRVHDFLLPTMPSQLRSLMAKPAGPRVSTVYRSSRWPL